MDSAGDDAAAHTEAVSTIAGRLSVDGWRVAAVLDDWPTPKPIETIRPDIRAERQGRELLVVIETDRNTDTSQYDPLRRIAAESDDIEFHGYISDETGFPRYRFD